MPDRRIVGAEDALLAVLAGGENPGDRAEFVD
jgi:hypothetical protein